MTVDHSGLPDWYRYADHLHESVSVHAFTVNICTSPINPATNPERSEEESSERQRRGKMISVQSLCTAIVTAYRKIFLNEIE